MMVAFFGERGDRQLDLAHFAAFVAALHAELVRLEFAHYSQGKVRGAPILAPCDPIQYHITQLPATEETACFPMSMCLISSPKPIHTLPLKDISSSVPACAVHYPQSTLRGREECMQALVSLMKIAHAAVKGHG